jgi:peptidoglycan/LPS O-acetylase OafA/YrhL
MAAMSVLIQHACEKMFPSFAYFTTHYFQFGVFGVSLFFLCSGFVIPVSLEKAQSLRKFWINRVFRLYPLYLLSMGATFVLILAGGRQLPSLSDILANLTMLSKFLGHPPILHLYWTLCLEMAFYIMISFIFLAGWLKNSVSLAIASLVISVLIGVVGTQYFHLFTNGWGTAFYFATMFMGFLYYRRWQGKVSRTKFLSLVVAAIGVLCLVTYFNLFGKDKPEAMGTLSFLPVTTAIGGAYLLFSLSFVLRNIQYPAFLLTLGVISYSLYLVQATVFSIIPSFSQPWLTVIVWLGAIILVSFLTYRLVEKPFMSIGKKLQGPSHQKPS